MPPFLVIIIKTATSDNVRVGYESDANAGAVGCSLLAYILPCMLDLKLRGCDMPVMLIIKDSAIIAFAVFASVSGLVIIMMTVIKGKIPP